MFINIISTVFVIAIAIVVVYFGTMTFKMEVNPVQINEHEGFGLYK